MIRAESTPGKLIAGQVLTLIRELNKVEQRRLGMLLSKDRDSLPTWRVVKANKRGRRRIKGLSRDQQQLLDYLESGEKRHENHVLRHMWPAEAAAYSNPGTNPTLRTRLRKVVQRLNDKLAKFEPLLSIERVGYTRNLYLHTSR
jgi:hypothetical protein